MGSSRPAPARNPPADAPPEAEPPPSRSAERAHSGRRSELDEASLVALVQALEAIVWEAEAVPFDLHFVSRGAELVLGYSALCWLETPGAWPSFLPAEARATLARSCDDCVAEDRDGAHELRALTATGEERWLSGTIRVLRDAAGYPSRLCGMMIDVTEQRRALAALDASERAARELVDGLEDAVFRVDLSGALTFLGGGWARLSGSSPARPLGAPFADFFHAEDREQVRAAFAALGVGGQRRVRIEVRAALDLLAGGAQRCLELRARPTVDAAGRVSGIVGTLTDVTDQRRAQQAAHRSQRMASIGTLAAGVAHELNSPLGVVLTNLDVLASSLESSLRGGERFLALVEAELGPERARAMWAASRGEGALGLGELDAAVRDARAGAERAGAVVQGIKSLSRADDEAMRGPVDVRRVLESALESVGEAVRARCRLVTRLGPVAPVDASEARLSRVFRDLLLNAVENLPAGRAEGSEVTVTTGTDLAGRVRIEIHDNGEALAAEALDRLFEPFAAAEATRGAASASSTVGPRAVPNPVGYAGLAACHAIVTAFGGELVADSPSGQGTRICVIFPPARSRTPHPSVAAAPTGAPARPRVLVIDDEPLIGSTVRRALGKAYDVVTVDNARDAESLVRKGERFDLLLSDLMMPSMSGMELHAAVLKISAELADRMVFMTGGAFSPAARAFLDSISNARIDKPFTISTLREIVDRELHRVRG